MKFVGLDNYIRMLHDPVIGVAIRNNLIILIGSVVIQVGMGLILAAILNRGIRWGKTIFRTIHFAPMVMSVVAVGVLWQLIYDPGVGILNKILKLSGVPARLVG
jgi:raffinose/stachyose/melibiose transport system permease protein